MNDQQLLRYSRHIMLPAIDLEGQEKLLESRVLVIGLGGLGSPVAMYLAAAGVGKLALVDFDKVDLTNMQRQIIHTSDRVGLLKVESAKQSIAALNPDCNVIALATRLEGDDLSQQVQLADLVVDGSDNFATRFAVNAACVAAGKPLVSGAAIRTEGQISVFSGKPGDPCYRCLYGDTVELDESCSENGVAAPLVGIVGSVQAMEAIKVLVAAGNPLIGRLLLLDALEMEWHTVALNADPECPVCGEGSKLR